MSIDHSFVVLIAGGTASGKSSIVDRFVRDTGAVHLGHDRYYFDVSEPEGHDFDHPDSLDTDRLLQDLTRLKRGETAELPVYDFASHTRTSRVEVMAPAPLIVVEGILVMSDPRLVAIADLTVFVDAPESVRLERRLARDVAERGRTPESVMAQYEATVRPNHDRFVEPCRSIADVILDGCDPLSASVERLKRVLPR